MPLTIALRGRELNYDFVIMRIFSLGDQAITIEFGTVIDDQLNQQAIGLADWIQSNPFVGFVETIPAFASLTVVYDLPRVLRHLKSQPGRTALDYVQTEIARAMNATGRSMGNVTGRIVEIPISFASDVALDLDEIATATTIPRDEVIQIFLARTYRVFMLGFLPGFAYLGIVDPRIAIPRKSTARLRVPKGSVGIAGQQTGIYPSESPGGWQIIGQTQFELMSGDDSQPCTLKPGDQVRFVPTSINTQSRD